tara:strand:+ start:3218 stop:4060 length:843 start_codon:yes stop_codon:yes gene_type:complete
MKYLTLLIIVLFTLNLNAQSLSEQTGENRSLYNAICIYNDITPGDIGMTEFRKLAAEYAQEVGCTDYSLYLYNGGNNLYILYFNANEHKNNKAEPFWGEEQQVDYTNVNCCGGHDAIDRTINIDSLIKFAPARVDTITIEVVVNVIDTVVLAKFDTLEVVKSNEYCDCTDLDLNEAWAKYQLLQDEYSKDVKNHNGEINSMCQVKLKRYMNQLQRQNHTDRTNERLEYKYDNQEMAKFTSNIKPKRTKKTKRRKSRKLGRGHAKTANNSFWQKLFPFANC